MYLYYHGGSRNHGCEALVRSTGKILNEPLTLYSTDCASDRSYGLDSAAELREDRYEPVRKPSVRWFLAAVEHKLTRADYLAVKYGHEKFFSAVQPGDLCLSIGGDNYCYPGQDILACYNRALHARGAKTVLWGCSVEPELLQDARIARDLAQYDLITARESLSYAALKAVNPNTVLVSDPAFLLDRVELPLPDGFTEGNTVGINLSPLILKSEAQAGIALRNYERLIERILATTELHIALIPHVVEEGNDDRTVLESLYEKYRSSGRVVQLRDGTCEELKGYIARCRFFVGARTHATIAAYSSCVPTLAVGYSVKARGIARDLFGTEEHYVLPVQTLREETDLWEAFLWLRAREHAVRTRLEKIMPDYRENARRAGDAVRRLMK